MADLIDNFVAYVDDLVGKINNNGNNRNKKDRKVEPYSTSRNISSTFGSSFLSCFMLVFCAVFAWSMYSSYEERKMYEKAIKNCGKDKACIMELENARLKERLARSEARWRSRY